MDNELKLSVVDSLAGMTALQAEWNRLLDESRARSISLRWEWLHAWWQIYHDGAALHVVLARVEDRLVGIAPLYLQARNRYGFLPVRTLRFLGTGEMAHEESASEYLDIIAGVGYEERVAQAVWEYLCERGSWDWIVFNDVLANSLVMTAFRRRVTQSGWFVVVAQSGIRYSIDLPQTREGFLALLHPHAAKRILHKRRKLEGAGYVAHRSVTTLPEFDQAFGELVRLHTLRWTGRGRTGVFVNQRFIAFHKQVARMLLPLGMLQLRLLSLDGVNIAALYNFRYGGTDYFYQGGFDVERAGKYSPGSMAHVYAIEAAILEGLDQYDFMKGGAGSYKAEFGCVENSLHDMCIFARSAPGKILALEAWLRGKLRPCARKWRAMGLPWPREKTWKP